MGKDDILNNRNLEKYDKGEYVRFCTGALIDKTLNTLEGILQGITLDSELNSAEVDELRNWCDAHKELVTKHPYKNIFDVISSALEDNILTIDEKDDILWLCQRLHSEGLYYDTVTADLQKLQGIIHGILADGKIEKEELENLRDWLAENEQLSTYYPYDEIYSLVAAVLKDGVVSADEENLLTVFFSRFADIKQNNNQILEIKKDLSKNGICALAPDIIFDDHVFCFTGKSEKAKRAEIAKIIQGVGGQYNDRVTNETNYLIVGNEGNSCWAFACYGRKVEKAMQMRKEGSNIILINEVDFWDSI